MIERGHKTIIDGLVKMKVDWVKNLSIVFWVDRSIVIRKIERILFYLNYEQELVFLIELEMPIWRILLWNDVSDTAGLLALRARQIQQRDEDFEEVVFHFQRVREEGKDNFDENYIIRQVIIVVGDLVLFYDIRRKGDMFIVLKLAPRWLGLYRIQ